MGWLNRMYTAALNSVSEARTSLENPQTPLTYPAEWLTT